MTNIFNVIAVQLLRQQEGYAFKGDNSRNEVYMLGERLRARKANDISTENRTRFVRVKVRGVLARRQNSNSTYLLAESRFLFRTANTSLANVIS